MTDRHEELKRRGLDNMWAHMTRAQARLEAAERTRAEAERERAARLRTLNDHHTTEDSSR